MVPPHLDPVAEAYQVETYRRMGGSGRAQVMFRLSAMSRAVAEAGVRGILNYAPINLAVPDTVHVQNVDPVVHLQRITFYI